MPSEIFSDTLDDGDDSFHLESLPFSDEVLKTKKKKCDICGVGDIVKASNENSDILMYGRRGIRKAKHEEYCCNFRNEDRTCRVRFYHGYSIYKGMRIYDDYILQDKVSGVSSLIDSRT